MLVLDILASTTEGGHPVAAPLPLGIGAVAAGPGPGFSAGVAVSPAEVYGSGWRFILPDVVLDSAHGVVWWGNEKDCVSYISNVNKMKPTFMNVKVYLSEGLVLYNYDPSPCLAAIAAGSPCRV